MHNTDEPAAERRARIVEGIVERTGVTEELVHDLVHTFYGKVRQDAFIGPIFDRVIGDNWDVHLAKMCDFWSSVMLMSGRYKGNPMVSHMRIKTIQPPHFERWLELFRETAHEICEPEAAAAFCGRADNIARSLQMGLFFRPGATPSAAPGAAP
ncbi:MAG TPA: group III truncated hemoglobin [Rhizomicrobium sp.]|nr:group III truncated hemoglobin [Rhizomicrobium sp.]